MNFLQLAKERYSVRKYLARAVEENTLEYILEAGRVAPTALNKQPQRFLIVRSKEGLEKLNKAGNTHGAPMAIVVCGLNDRAWVRPQDGHDMAETDAGIATTQMMLAAWEKGVGSCWITWFDPAVVRAEFNLPDNAVPMNILALGYADGPAQSADRHGAARIPLEEMVLGER